MSVMGEDAFGAVVAAHHREIHRYLLRITRRPSDADDLSQDTFLRAFRASGTLPPGANVRAWLFAIATNLSRNHFRGQRRRQQAYAAAAAEAPAAGGLAGLAAAMGSPEHEALRGEAQARLQRAVDGLPPKQRLAFIMRKMHDLDYDGIGQSLRCSAESARANVFQAMRKIRQALDEMPPMTREPRP